MLAILLIPNGYDIGATLLQRRRAQAMENDPGKGGLSRRTLAAEFDKMLYSKTNWSSRCGDPYEFLTDETFRGLTEGELRMRFPRAYGKLLAMRTTYRNEQSTVATR